MNAKVHAEVQAKIRQLDSISTSPTILIPLLEIMRSPTEQIKIGRVVELIGCDGSIAAQCLRLANSPLFGTRYIETVQSAVMTLGLERIRSLLFGLCVNRIVPKDKWVIESDVFWRHSLGCALVTQRLAQKIEYGEPEKAYLAGLLHDLGLLVNSILFTDRFRECLGRAAEQHSPLYEIEQQFLGFTHCDTGLLLCQHWGLSKELADAAGCHHDVMLLAGAGPLACLVHLSDLLCRMRYLGHGYGENMGVDLVDDAAWQVLAARYPSLENLDLLRLTLDIEGSMDEIVAAVDSIFGTRKAAAPART